MNGHETKCTQCDKYNRTQGIKSVFKFAIEGSMFSYSVVALPHVGQHVIVESYINVKVLTITWQLLLND